MFHTHRVTDNDTIQICLKKCCKESHFCEVFSSNIPVCLQAFVKMVGANVNAMEEQVTQAEGDLRTLPSAFKKIFRTMSVPGFLNVSSTVHF